MPLERDQHRALNEIVIRTRRMYRAALKMQTDHVMPDDKLADLYIDGQIVSTYTEMLWRQSGERARARLATSTSPPPTPGQSAEIVQSGQDDPLAGVE